jgi:hypothetical protein
LLCASGSTLSSETVQNAADFVGLLRSGTHGLNERSKVANVYKRGEFDFGERVAVEERKVKRKVRGLPLCNHELQRH